MFTTHQIGSNKNSNGRPHTVNLRNNQSAKRVRKNVPAEYRVFTRKKKKNHWGLIFFLALLFAASVSGYYYWNQQYPGFQGESAELSVKGTEQAISGDEVSYDLTYKNNDQVTLTKMELSVQWPDGFYFNQATSEPADQGATTWKLPDLTAGQEAKFNIQGQLVGTKDQEQQIIFRLSYQPENFSSDFQVKQVVTTKITDTKLDLVVTSSDKVLAGQDIEIKAVFKNITKETLFDLQADLTLPPDMEVTSLEPELIEGSWKGDLPSGEEIAITAKGKIFNDATGNQDWIVEIGQIKDDQVRRLMKSVKKMTLVNPNFSIDLKINGRNKDFQSDWGETLNYELSLTNNSGSDLSDVRASVLMDSSILDLGSWQGNGRLEDNKVIFDKTSNDVLANMPAGQQQTFQWSVAITKAEQQGKVSVDNVAQVTLEGLSGWQQTSPLILVSVGEGLSFRQGAYYNLGGQQVGSGQLPPEVGQKTKYLIVWSLDNGNNDFASVNVSAVLPPNVEFSSEGNIDEGSLTYDETARRVSWQLDDFSSLLLPLQATFEIQLTPTKDDLGQVVTLVNQSSVVASGTSEFRTTAGNLRSSQVVSTKSGDVGTVVE